jgi:hypothetical protein
MAHPSTRLRVPVKDTLEGLKVENAVVMRRLVMLTVSEMHVRSALELATGTPWDEVNLTDMTGPELEEYVASELAHGLGITIEDARERVAENKRLANPSQVEGVRTTEKKEIPLPSAGGGMDIPDNFVPRDVPTIGGKPAEHLIGE